MAIDLANLATDMEFSPAEVQHMLDNLDSFSPEELNRDRQDRGGTLHAAV